MRRAWHKNNQPNAIKSRLTDPDALWPLLIRDGQRLGWVGLMKSAKTPDTQMRVLKDWAVDRMTTGTQTPYAWFQFMKLIEVLDSFMEAGEDAGIYDRLPEPQPKRSTRLKALPENVVPFELALRQRAAE